MLFAAMVVGQTAPNFWKQVTYDEILLPEKAETMTMPSEYLAFSLDFDALVNHLRNAPAENSTAAKNGALQLQLPLSDGSMETFRIWDSPVLPAELAAKYPEIRTFAGSSMTNPGKTVRLGYGYDAFHAVVLGGATASAITWYATNQKEYHICFDPSKFNQFQDQAPELICGHDHSEETIDPVLSPGEPVVNFRGGGGEGGLMGKRIYRVAISTTGEYSQIHGGTLSSVLSSLVTAVNTLNIVLEREAAVSFILIPQAEELIFLDASTDPFSNSNMGGALMGQNQSVLNNIIGISAYDVGQVFTGPCQDVGGVVSGANTCSVNKGTGTTCNFTSNVAAVMFGTGAHEFGHQLGAGHTWNSCPGNEGQYSSNSAWEPGSGSTILSYKGACNVSNLPGGDNVMYHSGTIGQIWNFTRTAGGSQCGQTEVSSNNAPEIVWPYADGFYIPVSTPFELEAQATDENGDAMTYVWEQINLGPSVVLGEQTGTSPSFRVYDPSTSTKRTFPRLPVLLNNGSENTELLPTYTRNLKFRFLVRDNNVDDGAGGVTWEDVSFEATASAGPFRVTYPNESDVVWKGGQEVEVTWDVANTDNDLVKCHSVNIKLSVDGGFTYPYTLMSATPNDGAETVFVPDVTTGQARLRVEASENIFFDISNQNFQIEPADEPTYTLSLSPQWQQVCVPNDGLVELKTGSVLNFDTPVEFEIVDGLPAGVGVDFSSNPVAPGESSLLTLDMSSVTADGFYEIELQAIAGADTVYRTLYFNLVYSDFSALALEAPADGESGLGLLPDFNWTDLPHADAYDFQIATSPTFADSTILDEAFNLTEAIYTPDVALVESKIYYWRVRPSNECGKADFTTAKAFQTVTVECETYQSPDGNIQISGVGLPSYTSKLPVLQSGVISDVNVSQLKGNHDALADLEITLTSPTGTEVVLVGGGTCGNVTTFDLALNDESPFEIECPPLNGLAYKPFEPLAAFIGENTLGEWTLEVAVVNTAGQGGTFNTWSLQFCAGITPKGPFMVKNDTLYVKPLETQLIHNYQLAAEDEDNAGPDIVFTIVDETDAGYISKDGVQLTSGDQFTMTDIHLQKISYTNVDGDAVYDFFTFIVEDGTGGWTGTPRFNIVIDENAITGVSDEDFANGIFLFPNPANDRLNVTLQQPLTEDGDLLVTDLQGRLVSQQKLQAALQQLQLDLGQYPAGIYFLTVRSAGGVFAKKFVVQR